MGVVILVILSGAAIAMLAGGSWAIWSANRRQPDLPLLFNWAKGYNQGMGTFFGLLMLGGGVAIAVVVFTHL